jgi:hypothetical protein
VRVALAITTTVGVATAATFVNATATEPPTAGTASFAYTGAAQYFTVPAGVTSVIITAYGAEGGGGSAFADLRDGFAKIDARGGLGGTTATMLSVTPGQQLQVNVGGAGGDGVAVEDENNDITITPGAAGFNGGGAGTATSQGPLAPDAEDRCAGAGGGGGGASDVRTGTYTMSERVVVGAGGGGAGMSYHDVSGLGFQVAAGPGGVGGGANGGDGTGTSSAWNGTGGSQVAGGVFSGGLGSGGDGTATPTDSEPCTSDTVAHAEGGGGSGRYGGGSGAGGAGGGSAFPTGATFAGMWNGNGLVTISYGGTPPGSEAPDHVGNVLDLVAPVTAPVSATPRFTG